MIGNHSFEQRVQSLCHTHGEMLKTRDVIDVVESMAASIRTELNSSLKTIGIEISSIVEFIVSAKAEIAAIQPHALSSTGIPQAKDQLDAVVLHTEAAAGAIMDCADDLMTLSQDVVPDLKVKMGELYTRIYEASTFQDITGQRVTKVVTLLKDIEMKLGHLALTFGDRDVLTPIASDQPVDHNDKARFLDGPQLNPDHSLQADIDTILARQDM